MAKTSKTMLNSTGENEHPCLVPDFRGNAFNFSPLRIMFAVGLSYMALIMLRFVPSVPAFWGVFYHKWMLNLSKAFSASIDISIWFLSFNLLMWCITLIDFHILKNPCTPGINPTWSWCMSFLLSCWILFAKILLRIFASMFISNNWPVVFFLCVVFVWFGYQGDGGLLEWVLKCSFLWKFLKKF